MKPKSEYSMSVGSLLVIQIVNLRFRYVAKVISEDPLRVKVKETGPLANLKEDDIIVCESETVEAQDESKNAELLRRFVQNGTPLRSGLKDFGVEDGRFYELLPVEEN